MRARSKQKKEAAKPKPLIRCMVRCPMCGAANYQYRMNNRVFWNQEVDIDLRPYDFKMLDHIDPKFHPPLYYMWHCPECHFTSGYRHFIHPLKDVFVKTEAVAKRIKEAYANDPSFRKIVKALSRRIDIENMTFYDGLRLHLLSIVILELIEDEVKLYFLNLGRYCLHLAWLFRDLENDPEAAAETRPKLDELYASLEDVWPEMPRTEYEALNKAANYYDQTFERSPQVKTIIDEISILQVIARIYIKLDRRDESRKIINNSIANANDAKAKIDARLRDMESAESKTMTAEQSGELVTLSRRLRTLSDEGKRILQVLTDDRLKEHEELAAELIKAHPDKPRSELRKLLAAKNIDSRIIKKVLPPVKKKKKGLFKW